MIELQCQDCSVKYEQPDKFQEYANHKNEHLAHFYKQRLAYCGDCRKIRIEKALESLPKVLNILWESVTDNAEKHNGNN